MSDEGRMKRLCQEVLKQSCHKIYFELRFLEQAVFLLLPEENELIFFGSDGEKLYYEKEYLLKRYLQNPEAVSCDYLHTVIHCLYQHPFQAYQWEREYWDLASDIAAADVFREMDVPWISGQLPAECLAVADQIKQEVPLMSAPHIAAYLQKKFEKDGQLCGYRREEMAKLFQRDSHACWIGRCEEEDSEKRARKQKNRTEEQETDEESEEDASGGETKEETGGRTRKEEEESGEGTGGEAKEIREGEEGDVFDGESEEEDASGSGRQGENPEDGGQTESEAQRRANKIAEYLRDLSDTWKEAAESAVLNADSFSKEQGKMPDSMRHTIERLTREQYDYTEFLRKFAVMNERMKINMDEFDYSYYLYGLKILGKIPLIEPLEYREEKQIREFVIVIDTSGSCSWDLVERFLNKTYNILCQEECFADQILLHIIQCDAMVQEDIRIDSLQNMEEYIRDMELRGGGGTDFRPAFSYVEELCKSGELKRLCGLLYFTDGYGIFPSQPPPYKTAFIFVEREDDVRVPPWAMRLYLENV